KIRWHRTDLGEIESALMAHPASQEAFVLAREDRPQAIRLAGCLVAGPECSLATVEDRVQKWNQVHEATYSTSKVNADYNRNTVVWQSSYTLESMSID